MLEKGSVYPHLAAAGERCAQFPAFIQDVLRNRALADDRGIDFFQAKFFKLSVLYDFNLLYAHRTALFFTYESRVFDFQSA